MWICTDRCLWMSQSSTNSLALEERPVPSSLLQIKNVKGPTMDL